MADKSFDKDKADIGIVRSAFLGVGPRDNFELRLEVKFESGFSFFYVVLGAEISDLFKKVGITDAEGYKSAFEGRQCYVKETSQTGEFFGFVEEVSAQVA